MDTDTTKKEFINNPAVFNTNKNLSSDEVLKLIEANSPISIWDISKQLNINRNQLYILLRDFSNANLIKTKMVTRNNNLIRMIYYNKKSVVKNDMPNM